jgi:hypothetical protein
MGKKKFCGFLIKSAIKKKLRNFFFFFCQRDLIQNTQKKNFIKKFYLNKQKKNKKIKMAENFSF